MTSSDTKLYSHVLEMQSDIMIMTGLLLQIQTGLF